MPGRKSKDGWENRLKAGVQSGGHYVTPGVAHTLAQLGVDGSGTLTLFLEAVRAAGGAPIVANVVNSVTGASASDVVRVRAIRMDLDVDNDHNLDGPYDGSDQYLPGQIGDDFVITDSSGNYLGQQLYVVVEGIGTGVGIDEVVFEILDTTNYEGWTGNQSDVLVEGASYDDDMSFSPSADLTFTSGVLEANKAWAALWAKDTGALATVTATFLAGGIALFSSVLQTSTDNDGDELADDWEGRVFRSWQLQFGTGVATRLNLLDGNSDTEPKDPDSNFNSDGGTNLPDHKAVGDGLTALEEFRGYQVHAGGWWENVTPIVTQGNAAQVRMAPYIKNLLVEVDLMASQNNPNAGVVPANDLTSILSASSKAFADDVEGAGGTIFFAYDQGLVQGRALVPHTIPGNPLPANGTNNTLSLMNSQQNRNKNMRETHVHLMFGATAHPDYRSTAVRAISATYGTLVFVENVTNELTTPAAIAAEATFAGLMRSTVCHELTHLLLDEAGMNPFDGAEHLANGDGDFTSNEPDDAKFIMYNYPEHLYGNAGNVIYSDATRRRLDFTSKESVER